MSEMQCLSRHRWCDGWA